MKKNLILIFFVSFIVNAQNFKLELEYGQDVNFGVDNLDKIIDFVPDVLKLTLAKERLDYDKNKEENTEENKEENIVDANSMYVPEISSLRKDLGLAAKYIGKEIVFNKKIKGNLFFEKYGLALGFDIKGVDREYTNFDERLEYDSIRLDLMSSNKYIKGHLRKYLKGNKGDRIIDDLNNKENFEKVSYSVSLDPFANLNKRIGLDIASVDGDYEISPSFNYTNDKLYINTGVVFVGNNKKVDIINELNKIKYVAPGNKKIEYFKKWTKSEKDVDLSTKEKFFNDKADLENAIVSGYKGTDRIIGSYSGSLYGDNPITYVYNKFRDEVDNSDVLRDINSILRDYETNGKIEIGIGSGLKVLGIVNNKDKIINEVNQIINRISKDVYKKIGYDEDKLATYTKDHFMNKVPEEFKYLLPYINKDFDFTKIDGSNLYRDYLYFDGLRPGNQKLPDNIEDIEVNNVNLVENTKAEYIKEKKSRAVDEDFNKYLVEDFKEEYKIEELMKIKEKFDNFNFLELLTIKGFVEGILNNNKLYNEAPEILKDPASTLSQLDMLRGIYFHASEKDKNIEKLEEKLNKITFNKENLKYSANPHFKFNIGYIDNDYSIKLNTNLNKYFKATNEDIYYSKKSSDFNLQTKVNIKNFDFNNDMFLEYSRNNLEIKTNHFLYDILDFKTRTYLGYNINANDKVKVILGLNHLGDFGYIIPKIIKLNGNEYTEKIAKRDKKNNPIGKDGESIKVSETTEYALINKEHALNKQIHKRKIKASDYLLKKDEKAVNSMYKVYNIVSPRFAIKYMPNKNFEFTHELNVPVALNNDKLKGFNIVYSNSIKYIVDDSIFEIFKDNNLIKYETSGLLELGTNLGTIENNAYAKYEANLNTSLAGFTFKGKNDKYRYSLDFNPLVLDFTVRPKISLVGDNDISKVNLGIETKTDGFVANAGMSKFIAKKFSLNKLTNEIFDDVIISNKKRDKNEIKAIKLVAKDLNLDENITLKDTAYLSVAKTKGNLKFNVNYSSIKATNANKYETNKIVEPKMEFKKEDLAKLGSTYESGTEYIGNKEALYLVNLNKYGERKEIQENVNSQLNYTKYDLVSSLEYLKNKGIYFNNNLDFDYDILLNLGEKYKAVENITEFTKEELVALESCGRWGCNFKDSELREDYVLKTSKNEEENKKLLKEFLNYVNSTSEVVKRSKKQYEFSKGGWFSTNYEQKALNSMKKDRPLKEVRTYQKINDKKEIVSKLEFKKLNLNTNTALGYKFNLKDKLSISPELAHNLKLEYTNLSTIYHNDIKMFGDEKLVLINTIKPNINMEYKLLNHLNIKTKVSLPITFEKKKYKNTGFDLNASLEFKF